MEFSIVSTIHFKYFEISVKIVGLDARFLQILEPHDVTPIKCQRLSSPNPDKHASGPPESPKFKYIFIPIFKSRRLSRDYFFENFLPLQADGPEFSPAQIAFSTTVKFFQLS